MSIPSKEDENDEYVSPNEQNGIPRPGSTAAGRAAIANKNHDKEEEEKGHTDDTEDDGYGSDEEEANGGTTGGAAQKGGL